MDTTRKGKTMTQTIKDIYEAGIKVAEKLDNWKTTGFIITDDNDNMPELCHAAIDAASAILPGLALSTTLQIAEFLIGLDKDGEKALATFIDNDVVLADTVRAEYVAHTLGGTC